MSLLHRCGLTISTERRDKTSKGLIYLLPSATQTVSVSDTLVVNGMLILLISMVCLVIIVSVFNIDANAQGVRSKDGKIFNTEIVSPPFCRAIGIFMIRMNWRAGLTPEVRFMDGRAK